MIGETAAELRAMALEADDAAGYFAAMYARVTRRIADSIDAGRFADGARMDAFATAFAARYTRPRRGETEVPRCWQASWDVAGDTGLLVVQHLLLGINAHVNHDLPLAVVEIADRTGDLQAIKPDFEAINGVLGEVSVSVLADLDRVSRWVNRIARLGGDRGFNFSLGVARARAWEAAVRLHPLDARGRAAYVAELDRLVTVLAYLVTRPAFPASLAVRAARRLEERDPQVVIAALLGEWA
jgi:hypothetical protein